MKETLYRFLSSECWLVISHLFQRPCRALSEEEYAWFGSYQTLRDSEVSSLPRCLSKYQQNLNGLPSGSRRGKSQKRQHLSSAPFHFSLLCPPHSSPSFHPPYGTSRNPEPACFRNPHATSLGHNSITRCLSPSYQPPSTIKI